MHTLIFLLILSNFQIPADGCVDWREAKNFDFYNLPPNKSTEQTSWDEISKMPHLRNNEALKILQSSACKDTKIATWMDEYLLVVEFKNGKKIKLKVSGYGGFLYEPKGRFYYVSKSDQDKWQQIILAITKLK